MIPPVSRPAGMMILLCCMALQLASAQSGRRTLLQSIPSPESEMRAASASCISVVPATATSTARSKKSTPPACGSVGENCCCSPVDAPPKYYTCCPQPNTYCQFFEFEEFGPEGACPQPSLCLPIPSACGGLHQHCCPPATSIGDDFRCNDPNLRCVGTQANHTFKAFLAYSKDPYSVPVTLYGMCIESS